MPFAIVGGASGGGCGGGHTSVKTRTFVEKGGLGPVIGHANIV